MEKVYNDVRHIVTFVMQQFTIRNIGPYGDGVLYVYVFILSGVYRPPEGQGAPLKIRADVGLKRQIFSLIFLHEGTFFFS